MRRFLGVFAVIALTLTVLAQTSPAPGKSETRPSPSCEVGGRVVTASEGSPLKSARVSLMTEHAESKPQIYSTTTDSDGHFLIKDVSAGRYTFVSTRAGFVDQHYQAKGDDDGAVLSLKPGEKISDVLFRMIVSGVVTGRVTNDDSDPMVRLQVMALRMPSEDEIEDDAAGPRRKREMRPIALVRTDDRGQYRLFGLKPGEYYIKATDASVEFDWNMQETAESYWLHQSRGSEFAPVYYPGVTQASQAQVVPVKAGDEVQADFTMQRTRTAEVSGHVMGRNGPAKNTELYILPSGMDGIGIDRTDSTDEKGAFKIKGVPPGSYVITVFQKNDDNASYEVRGRLKIEINGENIDSLLIPLDVGASFQGRVTVAGAGSPVLDRIGISFSGADQDNPLSGQAEVKKDGTFDIKSMDEGSYAFSVSGLEKDWYVKAARLGGDDILEQGLQIEKAGSGGRIEVVISSASAQLGGMVSGPDGAAVGARVRIAPEPETPYNRSRSHSLKTDQSGHFLLTGLAPGTYRVLAKYPASAEGGPLRSEPQVVTLSERDHKTVDLDMVKPPAD